MSATSWGDGMRGSTSSRRPMASPRLVTGTKILRMAGTDLVWELEDSVDLITRAAEIETARASNQFVTLRARLAGQTEFAHLTLAHAQLAWWSLGEENNPSAMGLGP